MDEKLQNFKILGIENIKYVSFKNTILNNKVGALHLNNINNVKVRFETIE